MNKHTHLSILRCHISGNGEGGTLVKYVKLSYNDLPLLKVKLCLIIKTPNQLHMQPMNQTINSVTVRVFIIVFITVCLTLVSEMFVKLLGGIENRQLYLKARYFFDFG